MAKVTPFNVALAEMGQLEIKGDEDNPRIVEYFQSTTYWATDDETPWCAAFVNWCLEEAGVARTRSAAALSFLDWGVRTHKPKEGDLVVFDWGRGRGHVGFYVSAKADKIGVLGGNQDNEVNIKWYKRSAVRQFRTSKRLFMSKTAAASALGVPTATIGAVLSAQAPIQGLMQNDTAPLIEAVEQAGEIAAGIPNLGIYIAVIIPILTSAFTLWDRNRRLKYHNN